MAEEAKINIETLAVADVDAVDALMKRDSATLGFLPRAALEEYLSKESVLGSKTGDGQLIGYLLYDPLLVGNFTQALQQILPSDNERQVSIIKHLAKTASSEVRLFVTRD